MLLTSWSRRYLGCQLGDKGRVAPTRGRQLSGSCASVDWGDRCTRAVRAGHSEHSNCSNYSRGSRWTRFRKRANENGRTGRGTLRRIRSAEWDAEGW